MSFSHLRLIEPLLRSISAEGYDVATPIQLQAIPHVLEGRDVLGSAQTGTGKTAAFALPILQRLSTSSVGDHSQDNRHPPKPALQGRVDHSENPALKGRLVADHRHSANHGHAKRVRCLVLCPTRELALQIDESFGTYGRHLPLKHAVIFGGVNQNPQADALRRGIDILVATPGRLLDLMQQRLCDLRGVEVLVLDEADRMLDMGFIPDIRRIVAQIPGKRQTLLFSATMPGEIRKLADTLLHNPITVHVAPPATTVDTVDQSVYFVEKRNKPALLAHLYKQLPMFRTIVFTRTKHGADRVVRHLHKSGIRAEAIHGNKSQNARERALANFKSSKTPVLVATDIASRGIDVDGITHVVNYDLTHEPETYVHRIGRTARAGSSGAAIAFCDHEEKPNLKAIESLIKRSIPVKSDHPEYPKHQPHDSHATHERHHEHHRPHAPQAHRSAAHPRPAHHGQAHLKPAHHAPSSHGGPNRQHPSSGRNRPPARHPLAGQRRHGMSHKRRAF